MRFTKLQTSITIVFAVLIVIFTLQNTEVVTIKLWFWEVNTSRALMIVISIAAGTLFGMLLPPLKKKIKNMTGKPEQKEVKATATEEKIK